MQAKVVWSEGMSFSGTSDSGFSLDLGAAESVGGKNDGFRPLELLLTGLIGCTAMDVISILQKKRQQVEGFEVEAHAERAQEHPKVFTSIKIVYRIKGKNIDENAVQRAIQLSETRYCPAQAMFKDVVPMELSYEIEEA
ncbi:MAG: OsmC family protein [Anaerolineales bacterium]|nr:OsmC family protein [Anaerolineales bacterium]